MRSELDMYKYTHKYILDICTYTNTNTNTSTHSNTNTNANTRGIYTDTTVRLVVIIPFLSSSLDDKSNSVGW